MPSIRKRLTIVLAVGFAFLIVGTGFVMARLLEARVTEEFDEALKAKARALVALTEREGGHVQFDYEPSAFPEFEREEAPDYFAFWLDDGRRLLASRHLRGDLPRRTPAAAQPRLADVELPDGRAGRLVQIDFVPSAGRDVGDDGEDTAAATSDAAAARGLTLVVARSREHLDDLIAAIGMAILGVGGLAAILAALFVWRVLATGLAPVDRIAEQVEGLDAERLDQRVAVPRTPRELAPIVGQLNALLARLDQSFERERRFAGNVAHELRTPIAELRSLAEVGGAWPDDAEAVARFFEDVEAIAGRMEGVVADLLLLARCHAGIETVERSAVALRESLEEAWAGQRERAQAAGLRFDLDVPPDLVLDTDRSKLQIILANVLGNAVSYCRPGGTIEGHASHAGARFVLEVRNPAAPLGAEDLERLAEPFWRKDAARSASDHAGLGLSVVSELATLLGLGVAFGQAEDGTFCVRLSGPARGSPRPAPARLGAR